VGKEVKSVFFVYIQTKYMNVPKYKEIYRIYYIVARKKKNSNITSFFGMKI